MKWLLGIVVALAAISVAPRASDACSGPPPVSARDSLPANGDADVPTNVEIRVAYRGNTEAVDSLALALRPVGGSPVELTPPELVVTDFSRISIQRPVSPLEPNTTYELLDKLQLPCESIVCNLDEFQVFATFTTGAGPDEVAPAFAGIANLDSGLLPGDEDDTCGYYSAVLATLTWGAATDDGPAEWIRYRVYDEDGILRGALLSGMGTTGEAFCDGSVGFWPVEANIDLRPGRVTVRAVDMAGNEDGNEAFLTTVPCEDLPDPTPDAGVPDAAIGADAGPGSSADSGDGDAGCGCRAETRAPGGGGLLAVLVLIALVRRRQRA